MQKLTKFKQNIISIKVCRLIILATIVVAFVARSLVPFGHEQLCCFGEKMSSVSGVYIHNNQWALPYNSLNSFNLTYFFNLNLDSRPKLITLTLNSSLSPLMIFVLFNKILYSYNTKNSCDVHQLYRGRGGGGGYQQKAALALQS